MKTATKIQSLIDKGLNQTEIGKKLGISRSGVQYYIRYYKLNKPKYWVTKRYK